MKKLNYHELRKMWLEFYRERGHVVIPSASVVPENDASVLFTNAGMHPLVPFLMGESHPAGKRLANIQKCVRTGDIEEVGNDNHLTFFEMMGNWSLGDYFKREKIPWSFEFLTNPKYLGVNKDLISVTVFAGDEIAPRDVESAKCWEEVGIPKERIFFLPKSENWWQLPSGTGPCGPCSEMFLDMGTVACGENCNPSCNCGKYLEVGNDVYMEYVIYSTGEKAVAAKQKSVDTGMGLERLLVMSNELKTIYDSEIFLPAMKLVKNFAVNYDVSAARVLCEHTRAALFIISDGVVPTNTGAGYVLRRLIRRAVRMANKLGVLPNIYGEIMKTYIDLMGRYYPEVSDKKILEIFMMEVDKFGRTLEQGLKEFNKAIQYTGSISGKTAFKLHDTYGFPIELTLELATEKNVKINMQEYEEAKKKHAEASSAGAGMFKGGLADTTGSTTALHTATHLLLATLKKIYGNNVNQKGSNITPERLRFDFDLDHKMTAEEIAEVEKHVNEIIKKNLDIDCSEMSLDEAKHINAIGSFGDKYGEKVKVFKIGDYSVEICGGPHVANTRELGTFKILKEESVAAGIRRIKAILQK